MDSLNDILGSKNFDLPPEVTQVKEFVMRHFKSQVNVLLNQKNIIIVTNNSALAGSLRQKLHILQEQLGSDKKVIIRIDQQY